MMHRVERIVLVDRSSCSGVGGLHLDNMSAYSQFAIVLIDCNPKSTQKQLSELHVLSLLFFLCVDQCQLWSERVMGEEKSIRLIS